MARSAFSPMMSSSCGIVIFLTPTADVDTCSCRTPRRHVARPPPRPATSAPEPAPALLVGATCWRCTAWAGLRSQWWTRPTSRSWPSATPHSGWWGPPRGTARRQHRRPAAAVTEGVRQAEAVARRATVAVLARRRLARRQSLLGGATRLVQHLASNGSQAVHEGAVLSSSLLAWRAGERGVMSLCGGVCTCSGTQGRLQRCPEAHPSRPSTTATSCSDPPPVTCPATARVHSTWSCWEQGRGRHDDDAKAHGGIGGQEGGVGAALRRMAVAPSSGLFVDRRTFHFTPPPGSRTP